MDGRFSAPPLVHKNTAKYKQQESFLELIASESTSFLSEAGGGGGATGGVSNTSFGTYTTATNTSRSTNSTATVSCFSTQGNTSERLSMDLLDKLNNILIPNILQIEELIGIETLEKLSNTFHEADLQGGLELEDFKKLLKNQLKITKAKEGQIDALFEKIDWSSEGKISWDEFCTYMQLEYAEKEDCYERGKEVFVNLPAKAINNPHRESIIRIGDTQDGTFVVCGQDAQITFWSNNLQLKRTRNLQLGGGVGVRSKTKWITDFVIMNQFNKFLVATGDREIQFFELSSFEPYCQIDSLVTVPLRLDYCAMGTDKCLIVWGDTDGCLNLIIISSVGECLRTWKKLPKEEAGIGSIKLVDAVSKNQTQFVRWKVHNDWVQKVKYYMDLGQLISCSNHSETALVIGCTTGSTHIESQLKEIHDQNYAQQQAKKRYEYNIKPERRLETDENVFRVYKGVKTFDFSKKLNLLVTGGMDRILRIWNPYVSANPTAKLRGHAKPIIDVFIDQDQKRIFSLSTDKSLRIWDITDQNVLMHIGAKSHKIRGDIQISFYSSISKTILIATDQLNSLIFNKRNPFDNQTDVPLTHRRPIHAIAYNSHFKQIITSSEASNIKVWDFETGSSIFQYGNAHQDQSVSSLTFDATGRRLLSAGRDGCIRIWNYNNGHCLRTLRRDDSIEELCDLTYVEMNRNRYVIGVGWDRRINIFTDNVTSTTPQNNLVQNQQPHWKDDLINGHKDDILSIDQCPPNLIVTSSYDGQVIVWNMISGHRFCQLNAIDKSSMDTSSSRVSSRADEIEDRTEEEATAYGGKESLTADELKEAGQFSINKVKFLSNRYDNHKQSAQLVASGPFGCLHFWDVYRGGCLLARLPSVNSPDTLITAMVLDKVEKLVAVGDGNGFIYIWKVIDDGRKSFKVDLQLNWRGHVESVTCMLIVDDGRRKEKILITCSVDCTVRLWTMENGNFIGTLGQPNNWNIFDPTTYQHPMAPYDVLIDPLSLPDVVDTECEEEEEENSKMNEMEEKRKQELAAFIQYTKQEFQIDDETLNKQIKDRVFSKGRGKRLRHEKLKRKPVGNNQYQALQIQSLSNKEPTASTIDKKITVFKDNIEQVFA